MTQLFPVLFLRRTPWQRGHLGGIRLSKRSFTCAKLSAHSISSTTYPSKAYKALIFMVFTHPQSLLSSGLSLLTIMHSAWKALNETSSRYYIGNSWLNLTSFTRTSFTSYQHQSWIWHSQNLPEGDSITRNDAVSAMRELNLDLNRHHKLILIPGFCMLAGSLLLMSTPKK